MVVNTILSVNVNKIAWLRNAREGTRPDVVECSRTILDAGAKSITVHPRSDLRHIRPQDVYDLSGLVTQRKVEFNIEGNPAIGAQQNGYPGFVELVVATRPDQCTLVPDDTDQLTSDQGWDLYVTENFNAVRHYTKMFQSAGCRVSIFLDPEPEQVQLSAKAGVDRIELYTGPWVESVQEFGLQSNKTSSLLAQYTHASQTARSLGLGVNAGHDLDLNNLSELVTHVDVDEVSIGQAFVADALDWGLAETTRKYLECLKSTRS